MDGETSAKMEAIWDLKEIEARAQTVKTYVERQITYRGMDCDQPFPLELTNCLGMLSVVLGSIRTIEVVVNAHEEIKG